MKTIVYIDGFNFYYSTYRNPRKREANSYKWLDFKKLLNNLLHDKHEIVAIKYYTADVSGKNDPDQPTRQQTYLRALKAYIPELEIHKGMFLTSEKYMPKVDGSGNELILYTEEKGSDVNLAVHLLNDGYKDLYSCAVLLSNDGDLREALKLTKNELGKTIGWILPKWTNIRSNELRHYTDFYRSFGLQKLIDAQLPSTIPGTNIRKPDRWNI
ncbi:NYN domain-containing protein [Natronogracilivirga saccharolytica]|uniref:NYN domain-containing protein n=1 Tax=Natronogracilivirga saccharolytica TaxID=2812953 RepID=A0A8J7UWU6_9BACT|nr:NYN domain-containing protein [Natronogracilivirga saccharolytica]MBP3194012.1 NYN domain-containing protein [Natronogracilivirga saccharolytica]